MGKRWGEGNAQIEKKIRGKCRESRFERGDGAVDFVVLRDGDGGIG